jgi:hypothetical protein
MHRYKIKYLKAEIAKENFKILGDHYLNHHKRLGGSETVLIMNIWTNGYSSVFCFLAAPWPSKAGDWGATFGERGDLRGDFHPSPAVESTSP